MLLKNYTKEIFLPECNSKFQSVHCIAKLEQNIDEVIPYLNSVLGGFEYLNDPPAVTFKIHGKLITVHGDKIAINALKDENEAEKIMKWLKYEINDAWENRTDIEPRYKGMDKPVLIKILQLLPKTNCRKCNEPTCLVFATKVSEGVKTEGDCPDMEASKKTDLNKYMSQFSLDN